MEVMELEMTIEAMEVEAEAEVEVEELRAAEEAATGEEEEEVVAAEESRAAEEAETEEEEEEEAVGGVRTEAVKRGLCFHRLRIQGSGKALGGNSEKQDQWRIGPGPPLELATRCR